MTKLLFILPSAFLALLISLIDEAPQYGNLYGNVEGGEHCTVTGTIVQYIKMVKLSHLY